VKHSATSSPTNEKSRESLGTAKKLQKSPHQHDEVDLGDYDEETDEFAGYSGSNAKQYSTAAAA
jgi:hypothetical protein